MTVDVMKVAALVCELADKQISSREKKKVICHLEGNFRVGIHPKTQMTSLSFL